MMQSIKPTNAILLQLDSYPFISLTSELKFEANLLDTLCVYELSD